MPEAALETRDFYLNLVFICFSFSLGCTIGSFLNVCIHRIPLGISLDNPRRSFCPACKYKIPLFLNIPILSWLMLRGKCANCGERISPRYLLVELLTGILYLAVWFQYGPNWGLVLSYWLFLSLLIVATFIDFEHYIIPDIVTKGGMAAGVVLCAIFPEMMSYPPGIRWQWGLPPWALGALFSLLGGALGFCLIWLVVIMGKILFGKKGYAFENPEPWHLEKDEEYDELVFVLGGEKHYWSDMFWRMIYKLNLTCPKVKVGDQEWENATVIMARDSIEVEGKAVPLEDFEAITGDCSYAVIPREAMGWGDVKFMGMIGAFLGWKAVLFTVLAASVSGTLAAFGLRLCGRMEMSAKIPFGPYLALGGMIWLFGGERIMNWYFTLLGF